MLSVLQPPAWIGGKALLARVKISIERTVLTANGGFAAFFP